MEPSPIILEACVDSLAAAQAAERAGADRIELCGALELGGITPSPGLIAAVCERVRLPVQVLLRPRPGDFCYGAGAVAVMVRDAAYIAQAGAAGIVTGALTAEGDLDRNTLGKIQVATSLPLTFNRAIDHARAPRTLLVNLIAQGVKRVLSSGQAPSAAAGTAILKEWQNDCGEQLTIMPGGGIHAGNIAALIRETGCREFHFSAVRLHTAPARGPRLGSRDAGKAHYRAFPEKIIAMREAIAAR
ncbi:MAG: copper homeostasis protein CutC [Bacteroidota bacterium]